MRRIALLILIFSIFINLKMWSQTEISLVNENPKENIFKNDLPYTAKAYKEFQFFAFYINQAVASNMYPQSSLFNGQLVGRLFGQNSSTTTDSLKSMYVEQRLIPFFIYQPKLFNGRAILRASFEIDWTWGDQAYGLSGNKGSAISADQVNLQTQNIELELIPAKGWAINLGLQRLYDTPYNPYRTFFDKMTNTGYRLAYWGTDGVGISVRYNNDLNNIKTGFYKLYENLPEVDDDVNLFEASYERKLNKLWNAGGSFYYVRDRGMGKGGVSVFGQGLTSTLAKYNGAYSFDLGTNEYRANIFWTGLFFSRNSEFWLDRWQTSGFVKTNYGGIDTKENDSWGKKADVLGVAGNLRTAYRFGQTQNDYVSIDLVYTSGDKNGISDNTYSGVITGNTWGMPANIFIGTGSYLLFPHMNVVNRYTPLVSDISNMGYGITAGTFNIYKDIVPNKINLKVGSAFGLSTIKPENGGKTMGTEVNFAAKYSLGPFMSIELHAAHLWLGNFYDSSDDSHGTDINGLNYDSRPVNPWTAFIAFKWLMF
ncbi:MAG: hypothetical protein JEZ09_01570 [Salinivirgaceae bacterium]|nr:hypothetical protein [Salinivirgaceae bacterium]